MKIRQTAPVTLLVIVCCFAATAIGQRRGVPAVIAEAAPVMLLPEPGRTPLATLPQGTYVQVIGPEEDGWYQISFRDSYLLGDRIGYVRVRSVGMPSARSSGDAVSPDRPEPRRPAATSGRVRNGLSDEAIAKAVAAARLERGGGVRLGELRGAARPATAAGVAPPAPDGIRLQIHTPLAWIQQLATEAAARSQPFGPADVTDEMTEPVLRVTVYADVKAGAARRVPRPSALHHVEVRAEVGDVVVQPLKIDTFSQHVLSGTGRMTLSEGLRLTFPLDAIQKLRGPAGDRAVLITVVGATGEATTVRVERKHFDALPM